MLVRRVPEDSKGNGIQGGCRDGVLDPPFGKFARLQIITIEDLFAGKKPAMPPEAVVAVPWMIQEVVFGASFQKCRNTNRADIGPRYVCFKG